MTPVLYAMLVKVCPVEGVGGPFAPGDQPNWEMQLYPTQDGSLWRIDFDPSATPEQQQAAIDLLASTDAATLKPIINAKVWQLQAAMTDPSWQGPPWSAVTAAIDASGNSLLQAFFTHPGNDVPSNSSTLASLGQSLGMTPDQVYSLVQQASALALP